MCTRKRVSGCLFVSNSEENNTWCRVMVFRHLYKMYLKAHHADGLELVNGFRKRDETENIAEALALEVAVESGDDDDLPFIRHLFRERDQVREELTLVDPNHRVTVQGRCLEEEEGRGGRK